MNKIKTILALMVIVCVPATAWADSANIRVEPNTKHDTFAFVYNNTNEPHFDALGNVFIGHYIAPDHAFWKFPLAIPKGSVVTNAYISPKSNYARSGGCVAEFTALLPDNKWEGSMAFSTANYVTADDLLAIGVQGNPVTWVVPNMLKDVYYNSPDISSLVQARVDSAEYDPGDPNGKYFGVRLLRTSGVDNATRTFYGVKDGNDNSDAAILHVEWTPPVPTVLDSGCVYIDIGCSPAKIFWVGDSILEMWPDRRGGGAVMSGAMVQDLRDQLNSPLFPWPIEPEEYDYVVCTAGVAQYMRARGGNGFPPDPNYTEAGTDLELESLYADIMVKFGQPPIIVPPTFILDDIPPEGHIWDGCHLNMVGYGYLSARIYELLLDRQYEAFLP